MTASTTSRALEFWLPLPPNIANGRMHWRAKNQKRKAYFNECDLRDALSGWSSASWFLSLMREPPPLIELRATLYLGNHMDDDNALARLKWPVDWLKTRGYLVDDKRTHCRMTIPEQVVKRNQEYRVRIVLTPL